MAMEYRGNVIVLDDGTAHTSDMVDRVSGIFPNVLRMAASGERAQGVLAVGAKHLDVKTVVAAMEREEAYWALIPKRGDPVVVIADYLSVARHALANGFPALVLVATEPGRRRYERLAMVLDVRAPITTGALVLSGVGLAAHIGASLDVLLLGTDPDNPPRTWQEVEHLIEIRAGAPYLEQALTRAREAGLTFNWIALRESASRDGAVLDAVREGGYDLVLDDLRPIDVGPRIGRLRRVERQLIAGDNVDTAYRLLRDAPCDVGIVVDAVTINLVPSSAMRAGAIAALSIGMVGTAAGSLVADPASATATMVAGVEAPVDPAEQAALEAQAAAGLQAAAEPAAAVAAAQPIIGIPAPSPAELPAEVSGDQYAGYQGTYNEELAIFSAEQAKLAEQQQQQAAADQAVAIAQSDLALERGDVSSAQATVQAAEASAEYAQKGKDTLTEAEEARAKGSLHAAERGLQRQRADVAAAEQALDEARAQQATAAAAVAAQQAVVDSEAANMAAWDGFMAEADARVDRVVAPVSGYPITTGHGVAGPHWASGHHTGIDFAAPSGTTVVAAATGTVTAAGWNGPYGNQVTVQHEDGTSTTYSHMRAIGVSVGQSVRGGEQIGAVGSTGNSTGPHLHFELLSPTGARMNPQTWLEDNGAI